jgi:hypothetical protein
MKSALFWHFEARRALLLHWSKKARSSGTLIALFWHAGQNEETAVAQGKNGDFRGFRNALLDVCVLE